jgi:CHAD domain-containing protein
MTTSPDPRPFAAARACGLLDTLDFQLRRTLKKPDSSQAHDLRVAIRRFGQSLAVFESCFGSGIAQRIERELNTVMKLAGKVRDSDIVLKMLGELDPVPTKVKAKIERKRDKTEVELTDAIARWIGRGEPARWRLNLEAKRGTPRATAALPADLNRAILRIAQRFFDRGVKAWHSKDSGKALHRLRIATKRLRYTFELAGKSAGESGAAGDPTDRWGLGQLKDLQSGLGDIHDLVTVREILSKHHGSKKMLEPIVDKERTGIREFRELWKREFRGGAHRGRWMARATKLAETLINAGNSEVGTAEGATAERAKSAGPAVAKKTDQRKRPTRSMGQ